MSTQVELDYNELFIGGEMVAPKGSNRIEVISPSTEEHVGSVPEATEADVDAAVAAARSAFQDTSGWGGYGPAERADAIDRLAEAFESRAGDFAHRTSISNGMPISIAQQLEGGFPSALLRYYAGLIREVPEAEERAGMLGGTILVERKPMGVVGAIVPWNFPVSLAMFKIAPALAAGCTMVIKPSPETVLDSYVMAECLAEAGIPGGVLNYVPGGRELGAYLVSHPGVDKVAFTGSTAAGRQIAQECGRLLRPVTLELGGKSAAIVLEDADLSEAGEALFGATLLNNGQTCFLGTRVFAPRSRYDEVVDTFTGLAGAMKIGEATEPDTMIGPMVSARQRERVEGYIAKGKEQGARITTGGGRPEHMEKGFFVEPTIFADVENSHTIAQEEIFGPVLSLIAYDTEEDALAMANDSAFGLGGSVWTSDAEHGRDVARRVQTGTIGINQYMPDPVAPFGGVKDSGLGRELGPEGLAAYQQLQSVYLGQ
jgi:aldehyde dehydrogenase (NAD+)